MLVGALVGGSPSHTLRRAQTASASELALLTLPHPRAPLPPHSLPPSLTIPNLTIHSTHCTDSGISLLIDPIHLYGEIGHEPLSIPALVSLLEGTLTALASLHAHDIHVVSLGVHDLRIDPDTHAVVLAEAALLPALRSREASMELWAALPANVAPEVLASGDIGPKADVWSIGVLAYHLLTGVHPFAQDDDYPAMCDAIFAADIAGPGLHTLPESGAAFVADALCLDPQVRPTVQDLLAHPFLTQTQPERDPENARAIPPKLRAHRSRSALVRARLELAITEELISHTRDAALTNRSSLPSTTPDTSLPSQLLERSAQERT